MITKDDILNSIAHEIHCCKHIYGKLPSDSFDYRPTPGQRSTLELLRYISIIGIAGTRMMIERNREVWQEYGERSKTMEPDGFPAAMDLQLQELKDLLAPYSEEDMNSKTLRLMTGNEVPINVGLMNTVVKWLTAYKMQLFLYTKSCGRDDISTYDCWAGIDTPVKEQPAAEEAAA